MNILSYADAVRAHALVAPFVIGQVTRYNNKRSDHRMIKWIIPYEVRLRRAIAALKRAKIPFDIHENVRGTRMGFSIRAPLDFALPADPQVAVKANERNALAEALALVLEMASQNLLDKMAATEIDFADAVKQEAAIALVTTHAKGIKKAK